MSYLLRPMTDEEAAKVAEFRLKPAYENLLKTFNQSELAQLSTTSDRLVLRFIRGRLGDVDKAVVMFNDMLEWRKEYETDSAFEWSFEELPDIKKNYPHGYHKRDKMGRPIYIERVGCINVKELLEVVDVERMTKLHVQVAEYQRTKLFNQTTNNGNDIVDQQLSIIDLAGLGRQHLSRSVYAFIAALSKIDQNYYPEILNKMLIINAPWVFTIAWKVIRPWLHERTKKKIEVVSGDPKPLLMELIDEDVLPDFFGGKDTSFLQSPVELELAEYAKGKQTATGRDVKENDVFVAASEPAVIGGHKEEIVE